MNELFKQAGMELPELLGKEISEVEAEKAASEPPVEHLDTEIIE